jgi:glycosyltransferase involved in cell wall biosynthesis
VEQNHAAVEQNHTAEEQNHAAEKRCHTAEEQNHAAEEQNHAAEEQNHTAEEQNHAAEKRCHTAEEQNHAAEKRCHTAEEQNHAAEEQNLTAEEQNLTAEEQNHAAEKRCHTAEEVLSYYKSVDALLFPSQIETFGLPLAEASCFGLPIIAADLPYAAEVLKKYENKILIDPESVCLWADAMKNYRFYKIYNTTLTRPSMYTQYSQTKKRIQYTRKFLECIF